MFHPNENHPFFFDKFQRSAKTRTNWHRHYNEQISNWIFVIQFAIEHRLKHWKRTSKDSLIIVFARVYIKLQHFNKKRIVIWTFEQQKRTIFLSFVFFLAPEIVEVEYDPILGNVKSTRKRSSTITTHLEKPQNRLRSIQNRPQPLINPNERDPTPIWARRRTSHSTVKPSDLVREHDKREKLEANALRRLSRGGHFSLFCFSSLMNCSGLDLIDESVLPTNTKTRYDVSRDFSLSFSFSLKF